jgi:glycosyltransferase involved in cell wall biosynthesis
MLPPSPARPPSEAAPSTAEAPASRTVAYVMKAFPRLSETFIAHEIHQLERLGLALRLYAIKQEEEPRVHPVVGTIRAPLAHLPAATSLSGAALTRWLRDNLPAFGRAQLAVAARHPLRYLATLAAALRLAWQHRGRDEAGRMRLRKVYVKEFLQAGWIAADLLRRPEVGHLHGHFCHGVATVTWFAARLTGLGFSFTAHAKDLYQRELNPGRLLERKLGAARFVATCTCANAQVLRARHPRPDDVHAIYHGLDTDWFAPLAQAGNAEAAAPLILAVGRLVEKKGFDQLVQACARLRDAGVAFRCLIVGERGAAQPAIEAAIAAQGLQPQVRLHGALTQDELRRLYAEARVFALPCQVMDDGDRDGFPNVLAEAMAMGVPVVSTRISGIPELIDDGEHGLLVEPRDAAALAAALQRVLGDDGLRERLARGGRARICERFDSRVTTRTLRDLFVRQLAPAVDGRVPAGDAAPVRP